MQYLQGRKGIQHCPQCGSMMYEYQDGEQRRWIKCWGCGAQLPLDWGCDTLDEKTRKKL